MSASDTGSGPIHPALTHRSNFSYFFYEKHHRPGHSLIAQWLLPPEISPEEEFAVFNSADQFETGDSKGNLYGIRRKDLNAIVLELGQKRQQVAFFPFTRPGMPWHGYPIWPIAVAEEGEIRRPVPKSILTKMIKQGRISRKEAKRLGKGEHI